MIAHLIGVSRDPKRVPAAVLLPLRLFVGATFVYAGLQKLTDPQFFSPTAPGFIGRQMSGFVRNGSPLSPLISHVALPHAAQFGALIALCELWVGIGTLLGLFTRLSAAGGLLLSLTLYLTVTWTVQPYFLGADLPYALGWVTLLLAGPGAYTLDDYFFGAALRRRMMTTPTPAGRQQARPVSPLAQDPVARSAFMRGLGTAAALIVGSGVVGGLIKLRTPNKVFAGAASHLPSTAPTRAAAGGASGSSAPAGTTFLGNVKVLPANSAGAYTDPISGDPALLIHLPDGSFVAYDAVCTHAGCTVEYDPTQHNIVCPCHGAVYDPVHGAQVVAGPAPQPLPALHVDIASNGNAYAQGVARPGANAAPTPGSGQ